jgi:sugar phosphate permease
MIWHHRYAVLGILCCAYMVCYLDRMVMASAIPFIALDFHLSPMSMGEVLSAFFAGYALMQIPGGLLADRFGPRVVLIGSIVWFSVLTACTGMVSGLTAMLIVRPLFGLGEGPFPAASSKTVANWFPVREVGRANGLLQGATGLGAALAPLFVVALIVWWGWRSVFYVLSIPGFLLALLVWRYVVNSPIESRGVVREEISDYNGEVIAPITSKERFLASVRTPAVRWCAASLFLSNTVAWGLMNWLPTYLLQARGFGVQKMGVFSAITNFAGAIGYPLGGYLCDKYFGQRLRVPIMLGLIVSGGFTYLAAVAPTGEWAVACLALVFLVLNATFTATFTVPLVIVPKHAVGSAIGVVNTAGQLAGVLAPVLIGYILKITHSNFEIVLYSLVALTCAALYPASRIRQPILVRQSFHELRHSAPRPHSSEHILTDSRSAEVVVDPEELP